MDRRALLLYLQNVRDLEVIRSRIMRTWKDHLARKDREMEAVQTKAYHRDIPEFKDEGGGCLWWFFAIVTGMTILLIPGVIAMSISEPDPALGWLWLLIICSLAMFGYPAWAWRPGQKKYREKYEKEFNEVLAYNERQKKIAKEGEKQVAGIKRLRSSLDEMYRKKYDQATAILREFYSLNILANSYRNLASVVYIYDYMSSSQATLEETLIHEHMEDGIQRLERRMDEMFSRIDNLVYETRCIRDENRNRIAQIINQNNRMLEQLESVSYNTQDAAQYAKLAADYSKANAYFALAEVWK